MDFAADDYAGIAQRMRELEGEKRGSAPGETLPLAGFGFGIWFAPGDRDPGWCRINSLTGKWGVHRSGDAVGPTLFATEAGAQRAIDRKGAGAWKASDMQVRQYC